MSLEEGGHLSDILVFKELCIFIGSLVNFVLNELSYILKMLD